MFQHILQYFLLGLALALVYIITGLVEHFFGNTPIPLGDYGNLIILVPLTTVIVGGVADIFHYLRTGNLPSVCQGGFFSCSRFSQGDQVMIRPDFTDLDIPGVTVGGWRGTVMFASDSMIGIELEPKLWQAFDEDTHQLLEKANRHFAIIHVPEQALVHTKFDKLGPQVANAYWKRWEDLFKAHLTLPLNAITVQEPDTEGLEPKERVVVEELLESDGDSGLRCTIRYRDEHLTALFSDIEPEDGNKRLKDLFAYYHEHA